MHESATAGEKKLSKFLEKCIWCYRTEQNRSLFIKYMIIIVVSLCLYVVCCLLFNNEQM